MRAFAHARPVPAAVGRMPDPVLQPRAPGEQPRATPLPVPDLSALEKRRDGINRAARRNENDSGEGPLQVVLYALTGPDEAVHDQLAVARDHAAAVGLLVADPPIVDTLDHIDARTGADNPLLRRGYARALQMITGPGPVRGVVAASRTAVTASLYLYDAQLTWYADQRAGLWLARSETEI
ncbi:hypothetical protein ACFXJO_16700 [Streptomyces lavendulae]|uniref:hypothetical protein n=1 Tax=Streptomyces lavendulae TaxID=1914 RepID=UPI0036819FA9